MCESVWVSVSVGEGGVKSTWGRADTQSGAGRPGVGKPVGPLAVSLSPSFSVSLTCDFQLLTSLGGGVCMCVVEWRGGVKDVLEKKWDKQRNAAVPPAHFQSFSRLRRQTSK